MKRILIMIFILSLTFNCDRESNHIYKRTATPDVLKYPSDIDKDSSSVNKSLRYFASRDLSKPSFLSDEDFEMLDNCAKSQTLDCANVLINSLSISRDPYAAYAGSSDLVTMLPSVYLLQQYSDSNDICILLMYKSLGVNSDVLRERYVFAIKSICAKDMIADMATTFSLDLSAEKNKIEINRLLESNEILLKDINPEYLFKFSPFPMIDKKNE